ncbi:MAG: TonB-dependent receptor [Alphaproteobacteria bacterium]|nr:TonB-dependent receptor [Alphaproteobacteria bacterium]
MFIEKKILGSTALSTALIGAVILGSSGNAFAEGEAAADEGIRTLDEIVVTASRRSESLQTVAITVEAMSGSKIKEMGIDSFDDYISLLPGVSGDGQGPGKKDIYMRGINSGRTAVRLAGIGGEPGVAVYLDEAPISTAGRNVDLYAVDLQRIEVLKGPQGTLFGSSSQAGTVRLITNKPLMNEFQAGGVLGASTTRSGGVSTKLEAYVNIPAIEDKLAFRVAGYNTTEAGYIDNVFDTISLPGDHPGLGGVVPDNIQSANNGAFTEDDYNEATYRGIRVSALWQVNDDWDVLLQHTNQRLDTKGEFEFNPAKSTDGDLNVSTFSPNEADDRFDLTQWTVNGMVGGLEVIYNGSYADRTFQGKTDYTQYITFGPSSAYYTCSPDKSQCFSPVSTTLEYSQTSRFVQEVRFATNSENRLRAIGGVYYDDNQLNFLTDFFWDGAVNAGFARNFAIPNNFTNTGGEARPAGVLFFNDYQFDREEISVFGEVAYDITDSLTATFGARRYSIKIALNGSSSFGSRIPGTGPGANGGKDVGAGLAGISPKTQTDTIFKANLSWQINDDAMVYFTFSQGFRSGGFNRDVNKPGVAPSFDTDNVNNYEFGWKSTWLENTLRFNGAIYHVDFTDLQQGVLDFSISNTTFFSNVGDAKIDGGEFQIEWAATDNLNLFGSFSYIDSRITDLPVTLINIAPIGSALPLSPTAEGNFGARYHKDIGDYSTFAQGVFKFTGERFSSLVIKNRETLPGYTQLDLSAGIGKDNWQATFFIDNAFDTLGLLSSASEESVLRFIPTRPRTIGFRLSFDY